MSGIFGYSGLGKSVQDEGALAAMSDALPVHGAVVRSQWIHDSSSVALGARHPQRIGGRHFAENEAMSVRCVMDGFVYSETDDSVPAVESGGAELLLDHYLEHGTDDLDKLSGSFNVAWWDSRSNELIVATDKLGQRMLFYSCRNGALVFGSALANLMATSVPGRDVDLHGFSDLLRYGYILRERTLFEDIKTLPPGGMLRFKDGALTVSQYWRLDSIEPSGQYDDARLDALDDAFKTAVRRSLPENTANAIGLTGGIDSRCIFAAAIQTESSFMTHTAGRPNSSDVVIAKKLSQEERIPHVYESINSDRIGEWLTPMVQHQGAMVATLDCHPCQHFDAGFDFDSIVQGIGATFARGNWVTPSMLNRNDMGEVLDCLSRSIQTPTAKRLASTDLWRQEFMPNSAKTPDQDLQSLIDDYEIADAPIAVIDSIANRERVRKFLNKAIVVVRNCREAHYPFLDHELIRVFASIPIADRINNRILIDLMKRWQPKLLDVEYEKDLMPLSASHYRRLAIRGARAIRRRLAKRVQWVAPPRQKIPNHSYVDWSRNEIKEQLVALLYAQDAAFRRYLNWDVVEKALDEHFSGHANWESLVSALVVFEIAHSLWVNPIEESRDAGP